MTANSEFERLCHLAHDWRERIEDDKASDADRAAFERWLDEDIRHVEAWEKSKTLIAAYDHLQPDDIDVDLLRPLPEEGRSAGIRFADGFRHQSKPEVWAAAAAVLACIVIVPVYQSIFNSEDPAQSSAAVVDVRYTTGIAEADALVLSDGTEITIGAATDVRISFSGSARSVELAAGAAIFDVASDPARPFSVTAGDLTATALGTEFEVRGNGGVYRVAVSEGRVDVAYPLLLNGAPSGLTMRRKLAAGEQIAATRAKGLRAVTPVQVSRIGAWRNHKLVYDGATIEELVADANRYFDGEIVLDETINTLGQKTITASFDVRDRDAMLETLAYAFPIRIDASDRDRIILKSDDDAP
ncbi:FecR family protein [Eilatimonas milleporae]|uniref:FecR family protein n=1 Tax=Eilatimonas milleporae TaxID=911205 RepID=A0A3M0CCR8_9PROT|nr:FecR domain-containing protein [Eilatimonas milleporae]RMB07614.1 FecR family protein [Eilatimonas milleporae]